MPFQGLRFFWRVWRITRRYHRNLAKNCRGQALTKDRYCVEVTRYLDQHGRLLGTVESRISEIDGELAADLSSTSYRPKLRLVK
jgi:hypothetical protein